MERNNRNKNRAWETHISTITSEELQEALNKLNLMRENGDVFNMKKNDENRIESFNFNRFHDAAPMVVGDNPFIVYGCDIIRALKFRYEAFAYMEEHFDFIEDGVDFLTKKYHENKNSYAVVKNHLHEYYELVKTPKKLEFIKRFANIVENPSEYELKCESCTTKECFRNNTNKWTVDEEMIVFLISQFYLEDKKRKNIEVDYRREFDRMIFKKSSVERFASLGRDEKKAILLRNRDPLFNVAGHGRCLELLATRLHELDLIDSDMLNSLIEIENKYNDTKSGPFGGLGILDIFPPRGMNRKNSILDVCDEEILEKPETEADREARLEECRKSKEALEDMVGLTNVKRQLNKLMARKAFEKKMEGKLKFPSRTLHCAFTGNPGTGKTTVAKYYADMLYSIGAIKTNKLVVAKKQDLIAGYIGQTPQLTQETINKALGGVLFIDEAYTLMPRGERDFAHECIELLLQNMYEKKDDLVVIFAGYTKEMEEFINSNPGLKSRIANFIEFDDYTEEELIEILNRRLKSYSEEGSDCELKLEEDALEEVSSIIRASIGKKDFGNARFIENLIEKVLDNHAENCENYTEEMIFNIQLESVEGVMAI